MVVAPASNHTVPSWCKETSNDVCWGMKSRVEMYPESLHGPSLILTMGPPSLTVTQAICNILVMSERLRFNGATVAHDNVTGVHCGSRSLWNS